MPVCPNCSTHLKTVRQHHGLYYHCPECDGRAVTIPQVRRVAGDRFATGLLRQINANSHASSRACPFCNRPMRLFHSDAPALELDACKPCGAVWFDPGEFASVPEGAVESANELQLRSVETVAKQRLEQLKRDAPPSDWPEGPWQWIPAIFGFPVESETDPLRTLPLFTWALALLITLASMGAFFDLKTAVANFGFIPAEAGRLAGATLLTSFFLHGGIFHLLGNLYFLLVFGDNVEDFLGKLRYGLLILAATVVGDLVHLATAPSSTTPCIGASGGISGIIVFYALKYPHARLGIMFGYYLYFRWLQIPAWGALVLWLMLQGLGLMMQLSGFSNVAATAHLGGAAVGFAGWLWWRKAEHQPTD